jgi:hypothetical protein
MICGVAACMNVPWATRSSRSSALIWEHAATQACANMERPSSVTSEKTACSSRRISKSSLLIFTPPPNLNEYAKIYGSELAPESHRAVTFRKHLSSRTSKQYCASVSSFGNRGPRLGDQDAGRVRGRELRAPRLAELRRARDDARERLAELGGQGAAVALNAATDWAV